MEAGRSGDTMTYITKAKLSGQQLVRSAFLYGITRAMHPIHYVWMSIPTTASLVPFTGTKTVKVPEILWPRLFVAMEVQGASTPQVTFKVMNSGKTVTYTSQVFTGSSGGARSAYLIEDDDIPTSTALELEMSITNGTGVDYYNVQIFCPMPGAECLDALR